MQGNQSENHARLSWVYRVNPRIRAAAIFGAIVSIAAFIARIDGELAGPDILLAAYAGMFVVYILFRFGYFAERVLLRLHGSSQFTVQKLRSTQGGRRFNPTEPESFISATEANEELRGEDRVLGIQVNGDAVRRMRNLFKHTVRTEVIRTWSLVDLSAFQFRWTGRSREAANAANDRTYDDEAPCAVMW